MKRSRVGHVILFITVLALAALACQAVSPTATPTPTREVFPTAAPTQAVWEPGSPHLEYDHVIASQTEGEWEPEAGYVWASEDTSDLSVVWQAGVPDPEHSNVVSAEKEGEWAPAPGYEWVDANDPNNWDVVPAAAATESSSTGTAQATFESVTAEYDVLVGGKLGMTVHLSFTVEGLKDIPSNVTVFYFKADNTPYLAGPGETAYTNASGQLSVGQDFTPVEDPAVYTDFTVFLPYEAIITEPGVSKTDLKFQATVYKHQAESWTILGSSDFYPFTITR